MEKKKYTPEQIEQMEDEMDRIAYEKAMAEYRANPVTYTMDEVEAMLKEYDFSNARKNPYTKRLE